MIYNLTHKDLLKVLRDFNSTLYGKTMFLLCYIIPFLTLIFTIILILKDFLFYSILILLCSFFTLLSFVIGSIIFYIELRIYVNKNR